MVRHFLAGILLVTAGQVFGWNALGHRVIVQIAYDNLTPQAKAVCERLNRRVNARFPVASLVQAGPWLDSMRSSPGLKKIHYIDTPFTRDGTPLKAVSPLNAVSGLQQALARLASPDSSEYEKGFNLRIVLHVLADLHQPLHAASRYSRRHRTGDAGGNFFRLGKNPIAKNLHAYWDKGGGLLLTKKPHSLMRLQLTAKLLEARWPCARQADVPDISVWQEESFTLAKTVAYDLPEGARPSLIYQLRTQATTAQRLAEAGCRLAAVLNRVAPKA